MDMLLFAPKMSDVSSKALPQTLRKSFARHVTYFWCKLKHVALEPYSVRAVFFFPFFIVVFRSAPDQDWWDVHVMPVLLTNGHLVVALSFCILIFQINAEFQRITTLQLEPTFMSALDLYTPKLLGLFRAKGGALGGTIFGMKMKWHFCKAGK